MKAYLEHVAANATQLNAGEITQLLRPVQNAEDLFDGTLGYWDTYPFDLGLNPYYKLFNCKYYQLPIINKDTFCKKLQKLEKIGALTPVQHYQYDTPVVIIPKKEWDVRFIKDYFRHNQKLVINQYS